MTVIVLVIAYNCVVASLLINAGLAKLASPGALLSALQELFAGASTIQASTVRVLAGFEVLAGVGLVLFPAVIIPSLVVAALGLSFAVLGTFGWLTGSKVPCGCVAGNDDRPLGMTNIAVGLLLAGVLPLNLLIPVGPTQFSGYSEWVLVSTSLGSLLMCLGMNGRLALSLLRPAANLALVEGASR